MIIILMGVSGCGKTRIGLLLAAKLGWPFYEGDEYHPQFNIDKMAKGEPLDDSDREPWLESLHDLIRGLAAQGTSGILACSALKQSYRDRLADGVPDLRFVHLKGDYELIFRRLEARMGHYMKPSMLASQFAALEVSDDIPTITIDRTPEYIVETIRVTLDV